MREQQEQSESKDESNPFDVGDLPADTNVDNEEKKMNQNAQLLKKIFKKD